MYDYPHSYEMVDKFVRIYGLEGLQNYENLPPEGLFLLKKILLTPVWEGFYSIAMNYFTQPKQPLQINAPLFEKIREGQVWRVFTPCLLHANILHIFFNMLWLIYLGKIIEDRLNSFRYLFLILITAIVSNTAQYLMSGPSFLGFSGVICGMLAFVWVRQKYAPWEGYRLAQGTFALMFFFVMSMAGIQALSFFLKIYYQAEYFPSIANTAHITGGVAGYLLGRMNLMAIKN
jgi:GlpG protein